MKLDELARTSSTAARTAVEALEPPPIGEPSIGRSWRPILAAAAVLLLVVGGLIVLDRRSEDVPASVPVSIPSTIEVPHLGLDSDEWMAVFATDGSEEPDSGLYRFDYYGDASAERPFERDDLLVAWGDSGDNSNGETVSVRGVTGVVAGGEAAGLDAESTTLTWQEPNGPWILLASHHADADRLLEIADGLVVDQLSGPEPASIELDLVASDVGTPFMALRGAEREASTIAYAVADGGDSSLALTTRRGEITESTLAAAWWLGAPESVDLAAGRADEFELGPLMGDEEGADGRLLMWSPAPGVVAQLIAIGVEPDELARLADTIVELDDETWAGLLLSASAPDADADSFDVLYGEGGGEIEGSAYTWAFGEIDGQLCVNVATGDGGSGSCQDPVTKLPDGAWAVTVDQGTTGDVATWLILAEPSVDTVRATSPSADVTSDRVEAKGWSWFVVAVPAGPVPTFEIVVGGETVGLVEPGVTATEAPSVDAVDLTVNPSAVELGIADMEVLAVNDDGVLVEWFGLDDGRPCLVTDGAASTAACVEPGDITVFPSVAVDGGARTLVVLTDVPGCVSGSSIEGDIIGTSSVSDGGDASYELLWGNGAATEWRVELVVDGDPVVLEIPPDGTADFPADLCP